MNKIVPVPIFTPYFHSNLFVSRAALARGRVGVRTIHENLKRPQPKGVRLLRNESGAVARQRPPHACKTSSMSSTVLFLCTGNYYRSRFAEHFFNWNAENDGLRWRAKSKGLAVGRYGNIGPISRYTIERLNELGIPINGNSRFTQQVTEQSLSDASLVIALKEAEHREMLEESFAD